MTRLSVAVVGAGPAGATAARLLAAQGAKVVLLESRRLPRGKICGGGLTPKAQRLVPPSALETVERRIHRVEIRGGHVSATTLGDPAAQIAMVERSRFDLALAEAAATAGADIRDGTRVVAIAEDERGVTLQTDSGRVRTDVVVAGDGDPSSVASKLGLGGSARRHSLALTVDLPLADSLPGSAVLSFTVPGGYAWYFPKGDHASVGVGSRGVSSGSVRSGAWLHGALDSFVASIGLEAAGSRVRGHWLPQGLRRGRLSTRRVILVGDAAGTADPLLGEGIAYAIISAVMASLVVADMEAGLIGDLGAYDRRLRRLLQPPLWRLALAAGVTDRAPSFAMLAFRLSSWVRTYAVDVVTGGALPFAVDAEEAPGTTAAMLEAYASLRRRPGISGAAVSAPPASVGESI